MPSAIRKTERPSPLSSARRTIGLERAGLDALDAAFEGPAGAAFEDACKLIEAATGRVIVMGMGKSGHIGAKIAATLASTGTPAFFVHPAEASHGDLGMITESDVILALSWSGETDEFRNVVFYSRRFRVPLLAVTSRPDSTLARAADIALVLPRADEACPHGLAPTTSSLLQLALGDALAIALLEGRGFTADDFSRFHPGGSLGASLSHVSDIMHTGRPGAAGAARHDDGRCDPADQRQGFWLRRPSSTRRARLPASSPTAICGVTSPTTSSTCGSRTS